MVGLKNGTNASVGRNPVGRFTVVVAFLDPLLEPLALHWVMPVLSTAETIHRHIDIQTYRQTDRQTDRHTDRQTDRQITALGHASSLHS